jgi:hypothetical protein
VCLGSRLDDVVSGLGIDGVVGRLDGDVSRLIVSIDACWARACWVEHALILLSSLLSPTQLLSVRGLMLLLDFVNHASRTMIVVTFSGRDLVG